jgi:ElaB/YqjD/DUF883 family membrane-anchored ribosome-binding protein
MVETDGNMKSPTSAPDEIGGAGIGVGQAAGKHASSTEAKLWQLRRDVARLREDVAAIAESRAAKAAGLVRRNPWSAMAAAVCVGVCLGRRTHH